MNGHHPHHKEIETLVRTTLACGCPDEVFQQIEEGKLPGHPDVRWLLVGGRLLIYLWRLDHRDPVTMMQALLKQGREQRDHQGLNRFRLILLSDDVDIESALQTRWGSLPGRDEKTHLHVLPPVAAGFLFEK